MGHIRSIEEGYPEASRQVQPKMYSLVYDNTKRGTDGVGRLVKVTQNVDPAL